MNWNDVLPYVWAFLLGGGIFLAFRKLFKEKQPESKEGEAPASFGIIILILFLAFFVFNSSPARSIHDGFTGWVMAKVGNPTLVDETWENRMPPTDYASWKRGTDEVSFRAVSGREWWVIEIDAAGAEAPAKAVGPSNQYSVAAATQAIKYYNALSVPVQPGDKYKASAVGGPLARP